MYPLVRGARPRNYLEFFFFNHEQQFFLCYRVRQNFFFFSFFFFIDYFLLKSWVISKRLKKVGQEVLTPPQFHFMLQLSRLPNAVDCSKVRQPAGSFGTLRKAVWLSLNSEQLRDWHKFYKALLKAYIRHRVVKDIGNYCTCGKIAKFYAIKEVRNAVDDDLAFWNLDVPSFVAPLGRFERNLAIEMALWDEKETEEYIQILAARGVQLLVLAQHTPADVWCFAPVPVMIFSYPFPFGFLLFRFAIQALPLIFLQVRTLMFATVSSIFKKNYIHIVDQVHQYSYDPVLRVQVITELRHIK